eukprot:10987408-Alexandrium_andersonii.AAC.1
MPSVPPLPPDPGGGVRRWVSSPVPGGPTSARDCPPRSRCRARSPVDGPRSWGGEPGGGLGR